VESKKYKFHFDSGHGWLEVKLIELIRLGIDEKISSYSYYNNGIMYLEEDCDMRIFVDAVGLKQEDLIEVNDGDTSFIRDYIPFKIIV